jgi:hypothetical protein
LPAAPTLGVGSGGGCGGPPAGVLAAASPEAPSSGGSGDASDGSGGSGGNGGGQSRAPLGAGSFPSAQRNSTWGDHRWTGSGGLRRVVVKDGSFHLTRPWIPHLG